MIQTRLLALTAALCALLTLGGCSRSAKEDDTSSATGTTSTPIGPLSEQQTKEVEAYLNDSTNIGFLTGNNLYDAPQELLLRNALYYGGGIGRRCEDLTADEKKALEQEIPPETLDAIRFVFKKADIQAFLQKKAGIPLSDLQKGPSGFLYIHEQELYCLNSNNVTMDTQEGKEQDSIRVIKTWVNARSEYTITYKVVGDDTRTFAARLLKTADGYQFVANVEKE